MSAIALGMIIIAYLCGSISSAVLVCRIARLPDPRENGSGNLAQPTCCALAARVPLPLYSFLTCSKG